MKLGIVSTIRVIAIELSIIVELGVLIFVLIIIIVPIMKMAKNYIIKYRCRPISNSFIIDVLINSYK